MKQGSVQYQNQQQKLTQFQQLTQQFQQLFPQQFQQQLPTPNKSDWDIALEKVIV